MQLPISGGQRRAADQVGHVSSENSRVHVSPGRAGAGAEQHPHADRDTSVASATSPLGTPWKALGPIAIRSRDQAASASSGARTRWRANGVEPAWTAAQQPVVLVGLDAEQPVALPYRGQVLGVGGDDQQQPAVAQHAGELGHVARREHARDEVEPAGAQRTGAPRVGHDGRRPRVRLGRAAAAGHRDVEADAARAPGGRPAAGRGGGRCRRRRPRIVTPSATRRASAASTASKAPEASTRARAATIGGVSALAGCGPPSRFRYPCRATSKAVPGAGRTRRGRPRSSAPAQDGQASSPGAAAKLTGASQARAGARRRRGRCSR